MWPTTSRNGRGTWWLIGLAGLLILAVLGGLLAWWAYENDTRVRFRVQELYGSVRGLVVEQPVIVPTSVSAAALPTFAPTMTPTPAPSATPQPAAVAFTATPAPSPTAIPPSPTPLASEALLTGFNHEYQLFNNCGPASLAMTLSFWGWEGTQKTAATVLKPNQDDKNVSPIELYEYAVTQGYDAYIRNNGDLDTLRRFIAAGYPVLVEKGFACEPGENCNGWFGHYSVFVGYDDETRTFTLQDSYRGPNLKMGYDDVMENWRAFNYLYIVPFPAGETHDAKVRALLGPAVDLDQNYRDSLARAEEEARTLTGEQQAMAWFNVGTNLHYMNDYNAAALAYDQAREIGLPYRMLWYQFGPYRAYYYMGRYQEVVDVATFAIDSVNTVAGLEEAYYWRGLSEIALGQQDKAVEDFRTALARHPGWKPAIEALATLGLQP
jgi:tetratricopeptide (TPR) repeat protein